MKTSKNSRTFLEAIIPSGFFIKRILIMSLVRLVFLVASFFIYFVSYNNIPSNIGFRSVVAMILTLTIAILFLLPGFDFLTNYLKHKFLSEYLADDPSVSRIAYKRFDINSLIKSVFPDMVKISGSDSGKLGILLEDGTFDIYNYNRGRQKKIHTRENNTSMNHLILYLLDKKESVDISETSENPDINQDFVALRADFIIPFILREKVFGFLAVSSIPDKEAKQQLNLLSRQCALVIHNQNLSTQIVENMKYRQEEESAKRIQRTLQKTTPPIIPGLEIQIAHNLPTMIIEFFQTSDSAWNFLALAAGGPSRSAGLIHSYIQGLLYSRIKKKKTETFVEIKEMIINTFKKSAWKDKYGYLIVKIHPNLKLEILNMGTMFRVSSENKPNQVLASMGWKNLVEIESFPISFDYRGNQFLRMHLK
jgi:hypothetical protein